MNDWRGTPIYEGDTVLYPVRHGSSQWMVEGVVKELHPSETHDVVTVERQFKSTYSTGSKPVEPRMVDVRTRLVAVVPQRPEVRHDAQ